MDKPTYEFEESTPDPTSERNATSAFIALIATKVILLLMIAACSPQAHAQDIGPVAAATHAGTFAADSADVVIRMERIEVRPSPEDAPPRAKDRWQAFNDALDATRRHGHRVVESRSNDGVRTACHEPCTIGCCVSSGGFSLASAGFGR